MSRHIRMLGIVAVIVAIVDVATTRGSSRGRRPASRGSCHRRTDSQRQACRLLASESLGFGKGEPLSPGRERASGRLLGPRGVGQEWRERRESQPQGRSLRRVLPGRARKHGADSDHE
jgi:hypothetical protein